MTEPIRVLHVDDKPAVAELVAEFLERENEQIDVVAETSAIDGLTHVTDESTEIDCIVSDYDMPDMEGLEFLDAVREHHPDLPFILYTGKGSEEIASEAISRGVTDYLQKGSGTDQYTVLANRIENAVEGYRASQTATATRQRYEKLIEHASDIIFVVDDAGTFSYLSPAIKRLLGYTPTEMLGGNGFEYIHPDDREAAMDEFSKIVENPAYTAAIEFRVKHKDGSWPVLEIRGRNRLSDPHIEGIVVVGRDITDRKQREHQLERLHEATRDLMAAETRTDVAELASQTARDVLDFPLNGIHFFDSEVDGLVPITVTSAVNDILGDPPVIGPGEGIAWTAYETGEPKIYEDVRTAPDVLNPDTCIRSEFHIPLGAHGVLVAGSTEPDDFDNAEITLGKILAANVTAALDRAERESELRRQRKELRRQNERLDEFASIVSHDLRNPLNIISGSLEIVDETKLDDVEHLDRCRRAVDHMDDLIEDLLTLSREGNTVDEPEPVAMTKVVDASEYNVEMADAELRLETDQTLLADERRLQQLLENLIRNAVEHGGSDVTITVGDLKDGFYVEDDGPGIPEDERKKVFESAYSHSGNGTGFGLSIVEQIVDAHGWDVIATDGVDGGVRFEITGVEVIS